ncbi:MAG: tetratricopeptide repeat protein [Acidobacteriota bacterium]
MRKSPQRGSPSSRLVTNSGRSSRSTARSTIKSRFLSFRGQSCKVLAELEAAISYYKDYLSHFGANVQILNAIGECYDQLGNTPEALVAFEKSLEIGPDQEKIKKTRIQSGAKSEKKIRRTGPLLSSLRLLQHIHDGEESHT